MALTNEQLAEIRKRAEAATQGAKPEWYVDEDYKDTVRCAWSADLIAQSIPTEADAEFIAHAREDVPKLLVEIERLRADQKRLIAELKKADIFSEELERKYFAAKWPEVEASLKKYAAKIRRERNGGNL
jgi:hypothetical protein